MRRKERITDELLAELELARTELAGCLRAAKRAWRQILSMGLRSEALLASLAEADRAAGRAISFAKSVQTAERKKAKRKKAAVHAAPMLRLSESVRKATHAILDQALGGKERPCAVDTSTI